jgi:hypothetical protein
VAGGGRDEPADGVEPLAEVGAELAAAVTAALPGWVVASVERLSLAWSGSVDADVAAAARQAGLAAVRDVGAALAELVAADVDDQWTNPMTLVRRAVRYPTAVLREAGVGEVQRSAEDEAHFPDDVYDLTPRTFADVDPGLQDLGIVWGAVKARAHLARHRPGGGR